jgi:predicted metal-dependent RNase
MKKIILGGLIGISITTLFAFKIQNYEFKKATAEVDKIQGLCIFTDSKPLLKYKYLGTVKITFAIDTQYQKLRNQLIKKAKKEFPNADGLIMEFNASGTDKCEAIKFE